MSVWHRGPAESNHRPPDVSGVQQLRRLALIGVLLAVVLGVASTTVAIAAFGWDVEAAAFGHPDAILGRGPEAALLFRWGFLGDMFYSYLLLLPLALYLHRLLRNRNAWLADIGLIGAFAYILLGAAGAAILATAGASLIEAHAAAPPAEQAAIATAYELVRDVVYFALWQTLDAITAGTWMFTIGWLFVPDRPLLARLIVMLGVGAWALAVMTMLDIHSLIVIGAVLTLALVVAVGWFLISRRSRRQEGGRGG